MSETNEKLGGTLGLGPVHYQGGRDELARKCRVRDDEITKLKSQLDEARAALRKVVVAKMPGEARSIARSALEASNKGGK